MIAVDSRFLDGRSPEAVKDSLVALGLVQAEAAVAVVEASTLPELMNRHEFPRILEDVYPEELKLRGIGGTVVYLLLVDAAGVVESVRARETSTILALDRAGAQALQQARFVPGTYGDCRVATAIQLPVTFSMVPR